MTEQDGISPSFVMPYLASKSPLKPLPTHTSTSPRLSALLWPSSTKDKILLAKFYFVCVIFLQNIALESPKHWLLLFGGSSIAQIELLRVSCFIVCLITFWLLGAGYNWVTLLLLRVVRCVPFLLLWVRSCALVAVGSVVVCRWAVAMSCGLVVSRCGLVAVDRLLWVGRCGATTRLLWVCRCGLVAVG